MFQLGHVFSDMDREHIPVIFVERASCFPWKTTKNQTQEASYPPPSNDLSRSGLLPEISPSTRMSAFFRLVSLIP